MTENLEKLRSLIEDYNSSGSGHITLKTDEPMASHTSFRIGGEADLFLIPSGEASLVSLCSMISETGARAMFLGNGTNLLFSDDGFRGAVVSLTDLREISISGRKIKVGAGSPLITVCKMARDSSLAGLEFAYGIPGTVGGAVYMNAGAYGGQTSDVLVSSTYLDLDDLTVHTLLLPEHAFGYRESVYKHTNRVILSAEFELKEGKEDEITALMNDIMGRRVAKQPLEWPSAGSVFKRCEGHFTGQMIEESGLKGFSVGGAQVSEKHAGFIINKGGATAKDVLDLVEHIKGVIRQNYGLDLECEIISVGP